jgi:hypothetical protein
MTRGSIENPAARIDQHGQSMRSGRGHGYTERREKGERERICVQRYVQHVSCSVLGAWFLTWPVWLTWEGDWVQQAPHEHDHRVARIHQADQS